MDYELTGHFGKKSEIPCSADHILTTDDEVEQGKRRTCGCGVWALLVGIVACGIGCFILMSTNLLNSIIQKNLTLRNNSFRFETWRRPPVHALFRVYLFNYTNIEEYESQIDDKLKVEELGPYTYIETIERVDVRYEENGKLSYRDKKLYKFAPELSNGLESDKIVVPNIPYMGAVAVAKTQGLLLNLGISSLLKAMSASPFIDLSVGEFLWGYKDSLSDIINRMLNFKYKLSVPMFGIFAAKNRTQEEIVTIFTGEEDVMLTGVISQYGEKTELDYWSTRECNRIDGTDGTIYPLSSIKPNTTLYLYVKEMCRRVPFVYDTSKVDQHGILVYRYNLAKDIFESGKVNPGNRCFCNRGARDIECMPSGVFNVSPCAFGGPIVTSLPHFMHGDPVLLKDFEGLSPHPELHESFVEINPKLGLPISGKSRFQLNVMVRKTTALLRKPYKDQLILPVSWMDYGIDHLPDDLASMIYNLVLFIDMTEIYLSACFVSAIVVFCGLIVKKLVPQRRTGLFNRNIELSTVDIPLVVCPGKT